MNDREVNITFDRLEAYIARLDCPGEENTKIVIANLISDLRLHESCQRGRLFTAICRDCATAGHSSFGHCAHCGKLFTKRVVE